MNGELEKELKEAVSELWEIGNELDDIAYASEDGQFLESPIKYLRETSATLEDILDNLMTERELAQQLIVRLKRGKLTPTETEQTIMTIGGLYD